MSDFQIGPAGGCPLCYRHHGFDETCEEATQREREEKRHKAYPVELTLPTCEACAAAAVAEGLPGKPCLKCGHKAEPPKE